MILHRVINNILSRMRGNNRFHVCNCYLDKQKSYLRGLCVCAKLIALRRSGNKYTFSAFVLCYMGECVYLDYICFLLSHFLDTNTVIVVDIFINCGPALISKLSYDRLLTSHYHSSRDYFVFVIFYHKF